MENSDDSSIADAEECRASDDSKIQSEPENESPSNSSSTSINSKSKPTKSDAKLETTNPRFPPEIWSMIFGYLNFQQLLWARGISKMISKKVKEHLKDPMFKYINNFTFYDYQTLYLADILIQDQICWKAMKTSIGKFAMKYKIIAGALFSPINKVERPYMRFIHTRLLPFHVFKSRFKSANVGATEDDIILEWKEYKKSSWDEATYWERSVIKMELKFQNYLRSIYLKRYNTTIPISMNNQKLRAIGKIIVNMQHEYRVESIHYGEDEGSPEDHGRSQNSVPHPTIIKRREIVLG